VLLPESSRELHLGMNAASRDRHGRGIVGMTDGDILGRIAFVSVVETRKERCPVATAYQESEASDASTEEVDEESDEEAEEVLDDSTEVEEEEEASDA
jgi:hypothetical protein